MMRWMRPQEPADFEPKVEPLRATIARLAKIGRIRSDDFDPKWKNWKPTFLTAQHNRCAYCDLNITGWADIEHFRPKAGLDFLAHFSPAEPPRPKPNAVSDRGWWWLAYAWSNYLVACEQCNQKWKKNLFPLLGGHAGSPSQTDSEVPLLLHPFDGPDPEAHLTFDREGAVSAQGQSPYGMATIRTCGLYRPSLAEARHSTAAATHENLADLDSGVREVRLKALRTLARDGSPGTSLASVTRCIWRDKTDVPWNSAFILGADGGCSPSEALREIVR